MKKHFHEAANLFPLMEGDEFDQLVADIKENGLREPIWLDPNGKIIDGRNRYRACRRARVDPKFDWWDGEGSAIAFVLSKNLHRRHLSASQRAMVAAEAKPLYEAEAKARMAEGGRKKGRENLPPLEMGKARDHAAKHANVSPRTVESASAVLREGSPELVEKVKKGEITVHKALQEVRPKKPYNDMTVEEKAQDSSIMYDHDDPFWAFAAAMAQLAALPGDPIEFARSGPRSCFPTTDLYMESALEKLQAFVVERRQVKGKTINLKPNEERSDEATRSRAIGN